MSAFWLAFWAGVAAALLAELLTSLLLVAWIVWAARDRDADSGLLGQGQSGGGHDS